MFRYGRMNRAAYWLGLSVVAAVFILISVAGAKKPPAIFEMVLIFLGVPRLHDIGRSGWWVGGAIIVEVLFVIGLAIAATAKVIPPEGILIGGGIFVFVIAIPVIYLGTVPGDPIANRFGDPPGPGISYTRAQTRNEKATR